MALTGHLSDLSLSELIEFFCNQRKTGQLKVLYPQGPGYFYLQTGSVVDARVGVLRGIDAVYYAVTLPNADFEFGGAVEPIERTINQPWTQVVLEGLRRLDEGIVPLNAFPPDYCDESESDSSEIQEPKESVFTELESLRVPAFLTFPSAASIGKRKFAIAGAVAFAVMASVAVIGLPAGWYSRTRASLVAGQEVTTAATSESSSSGEAGAPKSEFAAPLPGSNHNDEAALAAKRWREKEKAKAREGKLAASGQTEPGLASPVPTSVGSESATSGPRKIAVTVTYDESGRVTQASGGDASAIRIARQKRFPPGKAGSATITIPIN